MYAFIKMFILVAIGILVFYMYTMNTNIDYTTVKSAKNIPQFFPKSAQEIERNTNQFLAQAKKQIDGILAIPDDQRTYANTISALDQVTSFSPAVLFSSIAATFDLVHPDDAIRNAARQAVAKTQTFFIDEVISNYDLYQAVKNYADANAKLENLDQEQLHFLKITLDDYRKLGMDLPKEQQEQIKKIQKELVDLELEFDKNIAADTTKVTVEPSDLTGLSTDFVCSLPKDEKGNYILGLDFPTYMQIMENCTNTEVRKHVWQAYVNRAYPINKQILETIIKKRTQLAQLLGFKTYAEYELSDQMVRTPARAYEFLNAIGEKAQKKSEKEVIGFFLEMPPSVQLQANGKVNPWDFAFLKNQYKKQKFAIDNDEVAQYFPVENTIDQLLSIYEQFFGLTLNRMPVKELWSSDLFLIEVIDRTTDENYGYLLLDLFPRENKFTHACEHTMIPVTYDEQDKPNKGFAIVIANFPKPQKDKPALLKLTDVNTFFHEFGHAIHALLGRTKTRSFSGTRVKRDFVEMPSQMLEEWLWDPVILKMVSSHYKTKQPLPDDLIQTIIAARTFDSGWWICRQLYLAHLSLELFNQSGPVDIEAIQKRLYEKFLPAIGHEPIDHFYASFGHLTGYGARYYGYMWSSVFAHELAAEAKKQGFLNQAMGKKYIKSIIGKGGSKDPNDLLQDFLGRAPTQDAFLNDMGLQ